MKINKKIGVIIMPIGIIGALFLISFLFGHTFSLQSENKPNVLSSEADYDILSSLNPITVGASDAPVTIIVFNDYQCHDCKIWYSEEYSKILENLIKPKKANLVFVDVSPFGSDSLLASEATYCANEQGKYSEYLKTLFNSQQEIDRWAKSEQLKKLAIDIDLDEDLFEKCLDSGKYEKKIKYNTYEAKKNSVNKIPTFIIINYAGKYEKLSGLQSFSIFEEKISLLQ